MYVLPCCKSQIREQQNNLTLRKTTIGKIQYSRETEQLLTVPLATTNVRLNLCVLSNECQY